MFDLSLLTSALITLTSLKIEPIIEDTKSLEDSIKDTGNLAESLSKKVREIDRVRVSTQTLIKCTPILFSYHSVVVLQIIFNCINHHDLLVGTSPVGHTKNSRYNRPEGKYPIPHDIHNIIGAAEC